MLVLLIVEQCVRGHWPHDKESKAGCNDRHCSHAPCASCMQAFTHAANLKVQLAHMVKLPPGLFST